MSQSYGRFSALYDDFMSDTDYLGWVNYIEEIFRRFNVSPKLLLDLGCGTGSASALFSARGYDVIGLDNSAEMLSVAKTKHPDILYICQDIREMDLYGTVDAVVSLCDVMNYILKKDDLSRVFKLVANYLNPGGLFIFDINTVYKYRRLLGNRVFARETPNASYIWRNHYYINEKINEYRLTFFSKRPDGLYERFREKHLQRAYPKRVILEALESNGFTVLDVYNDKTFYVPSANAERVFFVARLG